MLVATMTRSASTSPSVWTKPRLHGSSHSRSTRSTSGTSCVHKQLRGRYGPLGYSHGPRNGKAGTRRDPSVSVLDR
jgi:hypothetical protein